MCCIWVDRPAGLGDRSSPFSHPPFPFRPHTTSRLPACYDFLWGFSWSALIKIEGELFYPFLRRYDTLILKRLNGSTIWPALTPPFN